MKTIIKHGFNLFILGVAGIFLFMSFAILFYIFTPLPDVEDVENIVSKQSIILEDRNGKFLFNFSENEKRIYINLKDISEHIISATIAVEDKTFFDHSGINLKAFVRAAATNILSLSFSQGGSTITQQVVKNIFLTREKKIQRKLKEFILAPKLESVLDKEKILELYLNTISFGGVIYGVEEASNTFFNKKAKDVTVGEASYLAAILNAPTFFSPYGKNGSALESRKNTILIRMLEQGRITRDEYVKALNEKITFNLQTRFSIKAPHYVFYIKKEIEKQYGEGFFELEGKIIKTSLDLVLQEKIEKLVASTYENLSKRIKGDNIATLVLSARTGEILSLVGSKDFFDEDIDGRVNIIDSYRQPGSTIKPLIYSVAFSRGLEPETILYNVATQFGTSCDEDNFHTNIEDGCYSPVNFTQKFSGPISLRNALAQSINIPAVKTAYLAGLSNIGEVGKKIGISAFEKNVHNYGLSLALGSVDVKPFELAQLYSVFANEGNLIPYTWKKIDDEEKINKKKIFDKSVVQKITSILTDNNARTPVFGANSALNIKNIPVASKTGTTNNNKDIWVIGYSPDLVVLAWFGNTDGSFIEGDAFGVLLSPLYRDIFTIASKTYSSPKTFFSKNTAPTSFRGNPILHGQVNTKDPHNILHYITQKNYFINPKNIKNDPQYSRWEFGVQNWLKDNDGEIKEVDNFDNSNSDFSFNIIYPSNKTIRITNSTTIIADLIPIENTRYEFYINNKLSGTSHLPIFTTNLKTINSNQATIRIVAISPQGTYTTEKSFITQ